LLSPAGVDDATALTSFNIDGMSAAQLQQALRERFGIFTVARHIGHAEILRATVALTTTAAELARFVSALQTLAAERREA